MTGNWTPGPWTIDGGLIYALNEDGHNRVSIQVDSGYVRSSKIYQVRVSRREHIATMNLIAAAPDLADVSDEYEAWEADVILNADWTHDTPRLTQAQWGELLRIQGKRNAALAKARGETK